MRRAGPYVFALAAWAAATALACRLAGPALAPGPAAILAELARLASSGELFAEMGLTVGRALLGLALANLVGAPLGLAAGRASWALSLTAPLVAGLQACPPIVWVSIVMVWAGAGSLVPTATVFAATFPFVFSTTAQGALGLDRRILGMSRLYGVPRRRLWRRFILPGVWPFWLAGLSTTLAAGWKAAAVAEFLGSPRGVGAKIFWSLSQLRMERLQAWTLALVALGLALEAAVVTPLRRRAAGLGAGQNAAG
ncbi:MAG: ABC transporter permease subunit [Deltaproteobacteria bacterium]|nr:ABC transporter permease subunit [Deltaproteobacteria bacterium]